MTNWDHLVAIHGPAVWAVCSRLLGNRPSDTEECYQETWLTAWKASQRRTIAAWPAFLCSIATSRALDRLRRRYRQRSIFGSPRPSGDDVLGEVASTEASPVETAIATELSERLRAALAELPARQSEMFSLHVLSDWSQPDIAREFEVSVNVVSVTIHRARQRLRELLDEPH
ncbi:ECF RNA polymerase sigma factor SigE [Caulifigura coniformis]|uniref:ECF RNA polymerase sigma factor SigE n=1 Tax=Caulifigura coniformis TaxID=2527983 RepID=A0A517SE75_9PLAN|nr:sigma-70 family RNA polymerase sigma factor [Caulifigura coniformis]QDT54429.1 ECF RNA polymerase sigma factor SigE [Caulifigura coniformis]